MYIFTRLKLIKYCKTFGLIQMIQWLLDHPYHFIFARNKKRYFCSDALCKIKTLPGSIFRSHSIRIFKYNPFRFSAIRIKKKKKKNKRFVSIRNDDLQLFVIASEKKIYHRFYFDIFSNTFFSSN